MAACRSMPALMKRSQSRSSTCRQVTTALPAPAEQSADADGDDFDPEDPAGERARAKLADYSDTCDVTRFSFFAMRSSAVSRSY